MTKSYGNMTPLTREEIEFDHHNLMRAVIQYCDMDQIKLIIDAVVKMRPAAVTAAPDVPQRTSSRTSPFQP
jgi:hypothetical protein